MNSALCQYICLECASDLTVDETNNYRCGECDQRYAPLADGLPVAFFRDKASNIANAYLGYHRRILGIEQQIAVLGESIKGSNRKKLLLPVLKALHDNANYFKLGRDALTSVVDIPELLALANQPVAQNYGHNLDYLIRDWADENSGEIDHLVSVLESIQQYSGDERALVLGAGTGRIAVELSRFHSAVTAIDNSLGQVMQFYDVLHSALSVWRIVTSNLRKDDQMLKKVHVSVSEGLKEAAQNVDYLWADGCQTPLSDDSVTCVYSVYFSDVVPLKRLLKEVSRVLPVGGTFVHLGPLQYHFNDMAAHYSLESFCSELESNDFDIVHQSEHEPIDRTLLGGGLQLPAQYIDALIVAKLQKKPLCTESEQVGNTDD